MTGPSLRRRSAVVAGVSAVVGLAGCGGVTEDEGGSSAASEISGGGTLTIAVASPIGTSLDPLTAASSSSGAVSRQIHEPLVFDLRAPLGSSKRAGGLVLSLRSSEGGRVWTARLRTGVRFQDGSPLTSQTVAENSARWRITSTGRRLLPGLIATDAPRTSVVRFVFNRPVTDVRRRLGASQLGIVAASALSSGVFRRSGTGPFEVRERGSARLVMARHQRWWGRRRGLGPALDRVVFNSRRTSRERLAAIRDRDAQIATGVTQADLRAVRSDPLFDVLPNPQGPPVVVERSVRGVAPPLSQASLSEAWLTRVAR